MTGPTSGQTAQDHDSTAPDNGNIWVVVSRGGAAIFSNRELVSPTGDKLFRGTLVREVERAGRSLCYELIPTGHQQSAGDQLPVAWVSTHGSPRNLQEQILARVWQVVGGEDWRGLVVRYGAALTSPEQKQRLAKGSQVYEGEMLGECLHYGLVMGHGPASGWVSVRTAARESCVLLKVPWVTNRTPGTGAQSCLQVQAPEDPQECRAGDASEEAAEHHSIGGVGDPQAAAHSEPAGGSSDEAVEWVFSERLGCWFWFDDWGNKFRADTVDSAAVKSEHLTEVDSRYSEDEDATPGKLGAADGLSTPFEGAAAAREVARPPAGAAGETAPDGAGGMAGDAAGAPGGTAAHIPRGLSDRPQWIAAMAADVLEIDAPGDAADVASDGLGDDLEETVVMDATPVDIDASVDVVDVASGGICDDFEETAAMDTTPVDIDASVDVVDVASGGISDETAAMGASEDLLGAAVVDATPVHIDAPGGKESPKENKSKARGGKEKEPRRPAWLVVGGAESQGIIVRAGQCLTSELVEGRLLTGSKVMQLELVAGRLRYQLLSGTGPQTGWVSVKRLDKDLLMYIGQVRPPKRGVPLPAETGLPPATKKHLSQLSAPPWPSPGGVARPASPCPRHDSGSNAAESGDDDEGSDSSASEEDAEVGAEDGDGTGAGTRQGPPATMVALEDVEAVVHEMVGSSLRTTQTELSQAAMQRLMKMVVREGCIWEVRGGEGGLIVRSHRPVDSPKCPQRLVQGSLVQELELVDARMHYELVTGLGPPSGWITVSMQGKELVTRVLTRHGDGNTFSWEGCAASRGSSPKRRRHRQRNGDDLDDEFIVTTPELAMLEVSVCMDPPDPNTIGHCRRDLAKDSMQIPPWSSVQTLRDLKQEVLKALKHSRGTFVRHGERRVLEIAQQILFLIELKDTVRALWKSTEECQHAYRELLSHGISSLALLCSHGHLVLNAPTSALDADQLEPRIAKAKRQSAESKPCRLLQYGKAPFLATAPHDAFLLRDGQPLHNREKYTSVIANRMACELDGAALCWAPAMQWSTVLRHAIGVGRVRKGSQCRIEDSLTHYRDPNYLREGEVRCSPWLLEMRSCVKSKACFLHIDVHGCQNPPTHPTHAIIGLGAMRWIKDAKLRPHHTRKLSESQLQNFATSLEVTTGKVLSRLMGVSPHAAVSVRGVGPVGKQTGECTESLSGAWPPKVDRLTQTQQSVQNAGVTHAVQLELSLALRKVLFGEPNAAAGLARAFYESWVASVSVDSTCGSG